METVGRATRMTQDEGMTAGEEKKLRGAIKDVRRALLTGIPVPMAMARFQDAVSHNARIASPAEPPETLLCDHGVNPLIRVLREWLEDVGRQAFDTAEAVLRDIGGEIA